MTATGKAVPDNERRCVFDRNQKPALQQRFERRMCIMKKALAFVWDVSLKTLTAGGAGFVIGELIGADSTGKLLLSVIVAVIFTGGEIVDSLRRVDQGLAALLQFERSRHRNKCGQCGVYIADEVGWCFTCRRAELGWKRDPDAREIAASTI